MSQENQNGVFQAQLERYKTTEMVEQTEKQTYLNTGMNHLGNGQYKDAMDTFILALKMNPDCEDTKNYIQCTHEIILSNKYINLALEYLKFADRDPEKYHDALNCFTEALKISTFFKEQINIAIADTINKKRRNKFYKLKSIDKNRS